jgi:thioredoxin reductase/NAD-dependent dihydropyrimidine dehydrogenase PreA subunit
MEIVVAVAVVALAGIAVWAFVAGRKSRDEELAGRATLAEMKARGVEPMSLHPVVDPKKCVGTGACVEACPEVDVLRVVDGLARTANPNACIGHAECVISCPVDAITLVMGTARRGVDLPRVDKHFETNVPGLFVVGELGGMGLIYNAMTQAMQCVDHVAKTAPPKVDGVHQLVVVGAGPAGLAATLSARAAGLDVVTVDQETMGGTVLQYPRQKIVMTKPVKLPLYGKLHLTTVSKEDLLARFEDIVAKADLKIRGGVKVTGVTKQDGVFDVATDQGPLRAQRVILALGRRGSPRKLGVPGEGLPKVTYRLLEPEAYAGTKCLVVGGGDSAVEAAVALHDAGASVVLAYRGEAFSRIKPMNQQRLDASKVTVMLSTNPVEIRPDAVVVDVKGARQELPNDYVLVFAGGELPTKLLAAAGIEVSSFHGEEFAPAMR